MRLLKKIVDHLKPQSTLQAYVFLMGIAFAIISASWAIYLHLNRPHLFRLVKCDGGGMIFVSPLSEIQIIPCGRKNDGIIIYAIKHHKAIMEPMSIL